MVNLLFFLVYDGATMDSFSKISFPGGIGNFGAPPNISKQLPRNRKHELARVLPDGNCLFRSLSTSSLVCKNIFPTTEVTIQGFREWVSDQISLTNPGLADKVRRDTWFADHSLSGIVANLLQEAIPGLWVGLLTRNGEEATLCGLAEMDAPEKADPTKAVILVRDGVQEHFNVLVWGGVSPRFAQQAHEMALRAEREAVEGEAATGALLAGYSAGEMAQMRALALKFENTRQEQEDAAFAAKLLQELEEAENLRKRQEQESLREAERLQQELEEAESFRRRQEQESLREAERLQQELEERSGEDQATLTLLQTLQEEG